MRIWDSREPQILTIKKEKALSKGTFKKIGKSTEPMYGPRAILACGFTPMEQEKLMKALDNIKLTGLPVTFATAVDTGKPLDELLTRPDQSGQNEVSDITRAVIMSGITEQELQDLLSSYKKSDLARPLWATLTPFSEKWTLSALLDELKKERLAMERQKRKGAKPR